MSTHWDILCVNTKCSKHLDTAGFRINHGERFLHDVIKVLPTMIYAKPMLELLNLDAYPSIEYCGGEGPTMLELCSFASDHLGCSLKLLNEYGQMHDQCMSWWRCKCCDSRHKCGLKLDHEGDHGVPSKD